MIITNNPYAAMAMPTPHDMSFTELHGHDQS